jgi:RimJ/RimL family protein N-acetyltransferase
VITTDRLNLREFQQEDWARVLDYQSKPIFCRYNSWERRTEHDAKAFVTRFIDWRMESPRTRFQLAIELRSEAKMIGNCGIRGYRGVAEAEMGFELDPTYWGHGYATEATRALLGFAFKDLKTNVVRAQCVKENIGSSSVLRRLGMNYERTEPGAVWMKDRWWDTDQYSITADQWQKLVLPETEPASAFARQGE